MILKITFIIFSLSLPTHKKCIGMYLTDYVLTLYTENYKTLRKEIKKSQLKERQFMLMTGRYYHQNVISSQLDL